jgi:putative Holliday junction resolvase
MNQINFDDYSHFFNFDEFRDDLFSMKQEKSSNKILGIDFGSKKIGLASFSFQSGIISPMMTYKRSEHKEDMNFFIKLIDENKFSFIIIGASLFTDFRQNTKSFGNQKLFHESFYFINQIKKMRKEINFIFFDESFSSVFANQALYNLGFSRKKTVQKEDSVAASKILQDFLEEIGIF